MNYLPIPKRREIDYRSMRLIVGVVAISLPGLTSLFSSKPLSSISASYYEIGWSQSIFIGFLFALAAFMFAYNGVSQRQMVLSKVDAIAALCIVLFPCGCNGHHELVPRVHALSGALMFLILTYFCYAFYKSAMSKGHTNAKARATVYAVCGLAMFLTIMGLSIDSLVGGPLAKRIPRLTFYAETICLIAFGISWLTASRILPVLTRQDERFSPLRENNPD
jgi:hypothetical protein